MRNRLVLTFWFFPPFSFHFLARVSFAWRVYGPGRREQEDGGVRKEFQVLP